MADFDASGGGGHGKGDGKVRSKKLSTRVDLTPMVDLAFLLITFFMLTTTLAKPKAMQLNMPVPPDPNNIIDQPPVRECEVLTILLDSLDKVWYYDGLTVAMKATTFAGDDGIRKVIMNRHKNMGKDPDCIQPDGKPRKLVVLIKMLEGAKYKNMVDILDEMDITDTKIYAIQNTNPLELEAVANGGTPKLSR